MAETILTPEDIEEPQSRAEAWARLIYDKMTGSSSGGGSSTSDKELSDAKSLVDTINGESV